MINLDLLSYQALRKVKKQIDERVDFWHAAAETFYICEQWQINSYRRDHRAF